MKCLLAQGFIGCVDGSWPLVLSSLTLPSIYRFGNGLLGFPSVACDCFPENEAEVFSAHVMRNVERPSKAPCFLTPWIESCYSLGPKESPGVRSSAIFRLASEFSFWKRSPEELSARRQKERTVKPKKPKLWAPGTGGWWKALMKWGEEMGCGGDERASH